MILRLSLGNSIDNLNYYQENKNHMKIYAFMKEEGDQPTLSGFPINGFSAHRFSMTSRIRCFCPLYVVKIEMLDAG